MGIVCARPDNLAAYNSNLQEVDSYLYFTARILLRLLEIYRNCCPEYSRDYTDLACTLGEHATAMQELNEWVGRVGGAFRRADRAPGPVPVGVVLTTDEAFNAPEPGHEDLSMAISTLEKFAVVHPDPQRVHDWWFTFTDEERDVIAAERPDLLGNLDGIPCDERDKVNRIILSQKLDALRAQCQDLAAHNPATDSTDPLFEEITPAGISWHEQMAALNDQLNGLNAIDNRLNHAQTGQPPAFLLGLDTNGQGHAIIAINNPDTADNVITYVPGTTARLGSISEDINRSDAMVISAYKASKGTQTTSSITWVGYDAPQSVILAASDHYAKDAEKKLHNFETGLRTTHVGTPSRNTIIGHSYGSTTVGYTMRDGGLPVDNVIFVGSPGVGVEHASDLRIDQSHVYAGLADNDPVQYAPPESISGTVSNVVNMLEHKAVNKIEDFSGSLLKIHITPDRHLSFGRDPTVADFGASGLPTDPGKPLIFGGAHSQYWDPGSRSLNAIGQVAVGQQPHG